MPTGHFSHRRAGERFRRRAQDRRRRSASSTLICPHLVADQRPADAAGWRGLRRAARRSRRQARKTARLRLRLAQPRFRVQEARRRPRAAWSTSSRRRPTSAGRWTSPGCVRGGADPLAWIERYGQRIVAVHVKDIAKPGQGLDEDGWADVGHGTIDWAALIETLRGQDAGAVLHHGARQAQRHRALRPPLDRSRQVLLRDQASWQRHSASASSAAATSRPPISRWRRCSRHRDARPAPTSTRLRPRRAPKEFGVRAETRRGPARRPTTSTSSST